jgi:hypothetical protein
VTRLPCWLCHGDGYYEDGLCDVVACEGGVIHFPLTREAVMDDVRNGQCLGEHYECVAEYVEGTCPHCADLAEAEFAWMATAVAAHRQAGHTCNPYGAEACSCQEAW